MTEKEINMRDKNTAVPHDMGIYETINKSFEMFEGRLTYLIKDYLDKAINKFQSFTFVLLFVYIFLSIVKTFLQNGQKNA